MKIVVLKIYQYHRNRVSKVEVELFKDKNTCKQFVNKYFEDINKDNGIENQYNDGFIINEYEDYFYTIDEKEIK